MTGQEFSAILDLRIDKAYSAFLTPTEKNRIVREATIKSIKANYKTLSKQEERDDIITFIKTNKVFSLVNNEIFTTSTGVPTISDYDDVFAIKAKFVVTLYDLTITNASNSNPILITISGDNNLRMGEQIEIDNIIGNPAANGVFYIDKIKGNQIALYSDSNLQNPVSGNGDYVSGGTIGRIFYNYCLPIVSDKKIDPYAQPNVRVPRFEVADQKIKITPNDIVCPEITIDYLATPQPNQLIDVSDNIINIEDIYPIEFIYTIATESANLFSQAFKDGELFQTSNFELQKNS